jgi:hypothetical protein
MSKDLGRVERAIGDAFTEWGVFTIDGVTYKNAPGAIVRQGVDDIAWRAFGTRKPTATQRASIRRAMATFVRKHLDFVLFSGHGRTQLYVYGTGGSWPEPREHPAARAERIPAITPMRRRTAK